MTIVSIIILAACSEPARQTAAPTGVPATAAVTATVTEPVPTSTVTVPAGTPTLAVGEGVFQNPVMKYNFPDPFVLEVDGQYYLYATNSAGRNVQLAVSEDLVTWEILTDAMPVLPEWVRPNFTWAPEVMQVGEQYVLYYTARDRASNRQCIGAATAAAPKGKFKDALGEPLVCQIDLGGSIDAHPFRSGEKLYLYWKNDGNCCGKATWIFVQEMAPDGLSLVGEPLQLISNDEAWEGSVVEAPTMVEQDGKYFLFYSANDYGGPKYSIGYSTCQSPTGPCQDDPENPLVESLLQNPPVIGPGHQTVVRLGDEDWLVYHAWEVTTQGRKTDRRFVWMDRIEWENGEPVVNGPTTAPQEAPLDE